ncbi:MAG: beta-ketoacyl-ACP synthase II [Nitrospirae bacterium]|nr:beta-ketoacyl-ACP synthase II [Magnetococcales bacterium]HAT49442.1 beta-ketoacyl-[acyl-carrier-protein] synthase II [Alphaproteobacteria bacterium]
MNRRVVITGLGLVTPLGVGTQETWSGLVSGRSGVGTITRFDATEYASRIAGECREFKAEDWIDKKELRKMDLFMHFGLAAAQLAWKEAGIVVTEENAHRIGVTIGSGIGGLTAIQNQAMVLKEKGPRRISPFFIPMSLINLISGHVAILFGLKGPNHAPVTACATGNHAIGDAMAMIRRGDADVMLAGGSEAAICELGVGGFAAAKALSTRNDEPTKASRPWDKDRDGFVIAEGAGVVVLEEMEMAQKRGAVIYAEVAGYGMSGDAHHITAPSPDGMGAATCMRNALNDAKTNPDEVRYINAHGTSTPLGDAVETQAMKLVFGAEGAKKLLVSSTKSMTGHLLGAAGGVEAIFTALALYHSVVPPTINLDSPDPECDLDYVPHTARDVDMACALTNSFGFGGTNSSLLLKRVR